MRSVCLFGPETPVSVFINKKKKDICIWVPEMQETGAAIRIEYLESWKYIGS